MGACPRDADHSPPWRARGRRAIGLPFGVASEAPRPRGGTRLARAEPLGRGRGAGSGRETLSPSRASRLARATCRPMRRGEGLLVGLLALYAIRRETLRRAGLRPWGVASRTGRGLLHGAWPPAPDRRGLPHGAWPRRAHARVRQARLRALGELVLTTRASVVLTFISLTGTPRGPGLLFVPGPPHLAA